MRVLGEGWIPLEVEQVAGEADEGVEGLQEVFGQEVLLGVAVVLPAHAQDHQELDEEGDEVEQHEVDHLNQRQSRGSSFEWEELDLLAVDEYEPEGGDEHQGHQEEEEGHEDSVLLVVVGRTDHGLRLVQLACT